MNIFSIFLDGTISHAIQQRTIVEHAENDQHIIQWTCRTTPGKSKIEYFVRKKIYFENNQIRPTELVSDKFQNVLLIAIGHYTKDNKTTRELETLFEGSETHLDLSRTNRSVDIVQDNTR